MEKGISDDTRAHEGGRRRGWEGGEEEKKRGMSRMSINREDKSPAQYIMRQRRAQYLLASK